MKTVILAGLDNLVFSSADMLNPKQLKLIGFATTMEQAWNIYDENGNVKENIEDMPIMPIDAAVSCEPDMIILASSTEEDDTMMKYSLCRADYRGEVVSLFDTFKDFSMKTAVIRKLSWRLEELGLSNAQVGEYSLTRKEYENVEERLLARMPYPENVIVRKGWFPETGYCRFGSKIWCISYYTACRYGRKHCHYDAIKGR